VAKDAEEKTKNTPIGGQQKVAGRFIGWQRYIGNRF